VPAPPLASVGLLTTVALPPFTEIVMLLVDGLTYAGLRRALACELKFGQWTVNVAVASFAVAGVAATGVAATGVRTLPPPAEHAAPATAVAASAKRPMRR